VLQLGSVVAAIREKFPEAIAGKNVNAAYEAYEIASRIREPAHAEAD
jgi:Pyruvate/2-oxoacid:ferredoxin oxidoreductase gamma subunit